MNSSVTAAGGVFSGGSSSSYRQHDGDVFLYALDLIELNGAALEAGPSIMRGKPRISKPAEPPA
jgi:hypothetical protein